MIVVEKAKNWAGAQISATEFTIFSVIYRK